MILEIFIPDKLPGLNELINVARGTKGIGSLAAANKQKQENTYRAYLHILEQSKGIRFHNPIYVHFLWIEKNKRRDPDNIVSAKKYIFDGMEKAGLIKNDGWEYIAGFTDKWVLSKDVGIKPGVSIIIREVNNEQPI